VIGPFAAWLRLRTADVAIRVGAELLAWGWSRTDEPVSVERAGETRPVTEAEYSAHCARVEPPPIGCERHHEAGERCGESCSLPWVASPAAGRVVPGRLP